MQTFFGVIDKIFLAARAREDDDSDQERALPLMQLPELIRQYCLCVQFYLRLKSHQLSHKRPALSRFNKPSAARRAQREISSSVGL